MGTTPEVVLLITRTTTDEWIVVEAWTKPGVIITRCPEWTSPGMAANHAEDWMTIAGEREFWNILQVYTKVEGQTYLELPHRKIDLINLVYAAMIRSCLLYTSPSPRD